METSEINLRRFCAFKGIDIIKTREVQYGKQFTLKSLSDITHLVLFHNNSLVQGKESRLKEIIKAWANKDGRTSNALRVDLPSGWREWDENADWLEDYHKKRGIPKEEELTHRYQMNREFLFHDYMFRNGALDGITFVRFEKLVRAWFNRNCFMNINVDSMVANFKKIIDQKNYWGLSVDNVPFAVAAELLAEEFANTCSNKYICIHGKCYCPQTESQEVDCVVDIVDSLYPYYSQKMLSYTKGNLDKLIKRDNKLSWRDISPSTPIEQIMSDKLSDAGILTLPQYQAWDATHRYNIDFVIKTPQGLNIAIECDGLQFHARPGAYIHDRKRDRYLQNNGFYVMRFSSVEIYNEINNVITEIDQSYWKIQKKQLDIRRPYRISYFGYNNEE